jgi:hypothetical protein
VDAKGKPLTLLDAGSELQINPMCGRRFAGKENL